MCEGSRVELVSWLSSANGDILTSVYFRGDPIPTGISRPDIILAADCVYFEPAFPLLVQTLDDLSDSTTEILFCYKKRRKVSRIVLPMCILPEVPC